MGTFGWMLREAELGICLIRMIHFMLSASCVTVVCCWLWGLETASRMLLPPTGRLRYKDTRQVSLIMSAACPGVPRLLLLWEVEQSKGSGSARARGCPARKTQRLLPLPNKSAVFRNFPGGLLARTPCSQSWGPGFNHWSGNWIPQATAKTLHRQTNEQTHKIFFKKILFLNCCYKKQAKNNH